MLCVNDIFDELRAENTRLSDELLFANKCVHILLKFKCYLFNNYINKCNINDNHVENELKELENELYILTKERNTKVSEELVENVVNINGIQTNELTKPSKLSLKDKYLIVNAIDNRGDKKKTQIAKQFNISLANLWIIYRDRQKWIRCYNEGERQLNDISVETINSSVNSKCMPALKHDVCAEDYSKSYTRNKSNKIKAKSKSKNRFKCDWIGCSYSTKTNNKLQYHRNRHLGVRPFKCTVSGCDKAFFSKYKVKNHVTVVHELEKTIACLWPNCRAMFKTKYCLNIHMKIHSTPQSERPFACDYPGCKFRSLNSPNLKAHKLVHSDQKLYKCTFSDCDKSFKLESTMKTHLHIHNTEPQYKCDWPHCSVAYRCWKSLKRHKLKHENIDTHIYCCDWPGCDYRSDRKDGVKRHKVIHTDERNFPCSWPSCEKKMKSKKNLREHLRMHMNDKRHKCQWPGCDYSCIQVGNLKKHFNVHCKK